jgi:acetyltransferase-like isoleucine patch superfamily enzyme
MSDDENNSVNEKELIQYYELNNKFQLKLKLFRTFLLHSLAYHSLHPGFTIRMQKSRGVKIGKSCYIGPYVQLDLMYPHLIEIKDNVTIGSNTMIFAHVNPTANLILKRGKYPRKTAPIVIKSGAWINPGSIIIAGVTIGENSIVSAGSVVTQDVPDNVVVMGNPARVIKKSI